MAATAASVTCVRNTDVTDFTIALPGHASKQQEPFSRIKTQSPSLRDSGDQSRGIRAHSFIDFNMKF